VVYSYSFTRVSIFFFNLTLNIKKENILDLSKHTLLKKIIKNPEELIKLSLNNEIDRYLENNKNIFTSKHFIYPVGSSITISYINNWRV